MSVEDQATADERIPHLLATPAAVRFCSYEPALGPVYFSRWIALPLSDGDGAADGSEYPYCSRCGTREWTAEVHEWREAHDCPPGFGPPLDQIIVGGESGPGARPFDLAWARATVEQCRAAGVACFVKQLGADPYELNSDGIHFANLDLRNRKGGDWSEWPEDLRVREFPR